MCLEFQTSSIMYIVCTSFIHLNFYLHTSCYWDIPRKYKKGGRHITKHRNASWCAMKTAFHFLPDSSFDVSLFGSFTDYNGSRHFWFLHSRLEFWMKVKFNSSPIELSKQVQIALFFPILEHRVSHNVPKKIVLWCDHIS